MDVNTKLVVQRNAMSAQLQPLWSLQANPTVRRLRKFRHTRIGRVLTWPARRFVRLLLRRRSG
jgi:hypothetical protein